MANKEKDEDILEQISNQEYEFGFSTDIEMDVLPAGLNEDVIRFISQKKNEPEWLLQWRLKGLHTFERQPMPEWQNFEMPEIDFQGISYYAAPKKKKKLGSMDEVDPELLATFEKLGIPLNEQKILAGVEELEGEKPQVAVDAVFDSVSVATTFKAELSKLGIIFCSISEAIQEHPELVRKYL